MSQSNVVIDSRQFRNALGAFATGVTIVTTQDAEGRDVGLTASSFNSVSLEPPMVLWSLTKTSGSLPAFMEGEYFAVHVLAADQQSTSDRFSKRGIDKFEGLALERGAGGVPLLGDCSARFQCRTSYRYEGGDHIIFVGEVIAFDHWAHPPLAFHGGKYAKVFPRAAAVAEIEDVGSSFNKDYLGFLLGVASMQLAVPVRSAWQAMGLSECGYFVLSVLAAGKHRTLAHINQILSLGEHHFDDAEMDRLISAGWITVEGEGVSRQFDLTTKGRELTVKLFVQAKSAEQKAIEGLDWDDLALLKGMLQKIIRNTRV
ncbi:flavin reductase family protein [Pseudomonas sp. GD03860]|uniref:flavin reductase family protein n=1 Tax=Pseudomonas TaxID=286 RepID=UPI002363BFC5|nr:MULTISPECIES: flavin reductase family protein [Pseudomonas]MDD2058392.1 flavin reductase family protein [Pseudomonas putida]MDH0636322.1 flavin reductase family protein [Pseudomonas sp. GD03860]